MPKRILPSLRVLPVVREPIRYELVDLGQRQHFFGRVPYGHRRQ